MGEQVNGIREIDIFCSDDEMKAYLCLSPLSEQKQYTMEELNRNLSAAGIAFGIRKDVLEKMIQDKIYYQNVVIAEGTEPVAGEDGKFIFHFATEVDTKPKVLKDGSVDYATYGEIPSVAKDEEVATYVLSTQPKDGMTVHGEIVSAKRGKELGRLRGKGFYVSEDGLHYYAKYSGKVTQEDDRLSIEEELIVEEDVSNLTGNIRFAGDVHIRGNVMRGMMVVAEKGTITVDGFVEAATLVAGKDIVLKNGMQGNGAGKLAAKGNVSGKFFEQVTIDCDGDVNANAIMNCFVSSGQDIVVSGKYGIIIGGEINAMRMIEATIIGNMSEVKTKICAGIAADLYALLCQAKSQKAQLEQEAQKIVVAIAKIDEMIQTAGRKDLLEKKLQIIRAKVEKQTRIKEYKEKCEEYLSQIEKSKQAKVTVQKTIYPGASIMINGVEVKVKEANSHVEYARRGPGLVVYKIEN